MMTGNMAVYARPYALAAFETALESQSLPAWETMLQSASAMVQDESVARLLNSPDIQSTQSGSLFCDVLARLLTPSMANFIRLLAVNKRLPVLPDIAALFTDYRMQHDKMVQVELVSATQVDATQLQRFTDNLTKRLQRRVSLTHEVDTSLLGGAIIKAGDMVIDGSVRGKLNRLLESL